MNTLAPRRTGRLVRSAEVRRWMDFVKRIPRIDDEEALELARRFREGDAHAGEQLVAAHLYVVLQVALRLSVHAEHALDVVQEGNGGLLDALHRFDPDRGVPFSVYSRYWARARMLAYVSTYRRLVQPGRPTRRLLTKILQEVDARRARGDATDDAAVAEALGVTVEAIEHARTSVPLPDHQYDAADGLDQVAAFTPDPETLASRHEISQRVSEAMVSFADTLENERDEVLFFERVASDEPVSLADLGRRFGVSRERMRQLEARLVPRFREHLERAVA